MNIVKKTIFTLLTLSAFGAFATVATLHVNKADVAVTGTGSSTKSVTISKEQLNATVLSDLEGGQDNDSNNKGDQKFTIELGDGKFIYGAVIFSDCGHQFIGDTLGDAFGIDNTYSGAGRNAYNFNLLFSFDKAIGMSATVDVTATNTGVKDVAELCLKFIKSTVGTGLGFYERFTAKTGGYDYDKLTKLPGAALDYYSTGTGQYAANPCDLSTSPKNPTITANTGTDGTYNVAVFQFIYNNDDFIEINNKISCTLQSLTFTYSCF